MREQLAVHCINLEHRDLRKLQAETQAKEQGFYIKFWMGIIDRLDRKRGVCLAHKQIVRYAKENEMKMVCIAEDDFLFFTYKHNGWDFFLDNIPKDFDLYFAMIYPGVINAENRITSVFSAMTMYVVHSRFYDFFLSLPDSCHLDRELGLTANIHRYMVCPEFVCEQDGSISDNTFSACDYSPYLEGRKIYGKD